VMSVRESECVYERVRVSESFVLVLSLRFASQPYSGLHASWLVILTFFFGVCCFVLFCFAGTLSLAPHTRKPTDSVATLEQVHSTG
jgi:hypothetical protein